MAQKRNPVSLRLQTRLQGYEKRFASCWFTDSFFSQVCANDLSWRLYCGHLLQKGGGWYSEVSKSYIPESCLSLQFLYRRCFIISTVLDGRKEDYTISNPGVRDRRQDTLVSLRPESVFSYVTDSALHSEAVQTEGCGKKINNFENQSYRSCINQNGPLSAGKSSLPVGTKDQKSSTDVTYIAEARAFASLYAQHKQRLSLVLHNPSLCKQSRARYHKNINTLFDLYNSEHKEISSRYHINPVLSTLSLLEFICNLSRQEQRKKTFSKHGSFVKSFVLQEQCIQDQRAGVDTRLLAGHWTSINLIRGLSAVQNVEFCLSSVVLLYRQRFSFLKIKDTIFKKLGSHPNIRGARLVCSGRQGGRSKSAMRAKKQSAILGHTALSLFSSRLAFASTNVDTTFGQIGVKLWICYK